MYMRKTAVYYRGMIIIAKFPGTCSECKEHIAVGDEINWTKGEKPRHSEWHHEWVANIRLESLKISEYLVSMNAHLVDKFFLV